MLKKTLFIENPCFINVSNGLLKISNKQDNSSETICFDDIGYILIEHPQSTITLGAIQLSAQNNVVIIFCDYSHHPVSICMPLYFHSTQTQILNKQISMTQSLRKNIWKQLIYHKIKNQSRLLKKCNKSNQYLEKILQKLTYSTLNKSESSASRYYWQNIFNLDKFTRNPDGDAPNNLLNYGYSILRAATARALIGSGLLPQIAIHHHNKYNPLPLADDVMEPYRPFVDEIVLSLVKQGDYFMLHKENKLELLKLLVCDTKIGKVKRPLMIALTYTTASLVKVITGQTRLLNLPILE